MYQPHAVNQTGFAESTALVASQLFFSLGSKRGFPSSNTANCKTATTRLVLDRPFLVLAKATESDWKEFPPF